jgi:UrcA family protein
MRIAIVAAAVGALFATQAAAATVRADNLEQRAVSFRAVNFNDQQQVDAFYGRLRSTAREVCGANYGSRSRVADRACVASIMDQAVSGMQRPMLTAKHQVATDNSRYATGF